MAYPVQAAPSVNNWRDHFTGASLNARWGTILSGTGTAAVSDSVVELNTNGLNSAAALYLATQIDKTKTQRIRLAVAYPTSGAVAGFAPAFCALVNDATAPVADTKNNRTAKVISRANFSNQSSLAILHSYFDASNVEHFWDGQNVSPAFTPTYTFALASQMPIREDDYYIIGLDIDGPGARFRWVGWGQSFATPNTYTNEQGLREFALTDWIAWSSCRDSSHIWLLVGVPFNNDAGSAHVCRVEWVDWAEALSAPIEAIAANLKDSTANGHQLRHFTSLDGELFLPDDRTSQALTNGASGSFDEAGLQEPRWITDGVGADYLFYTGTNASTFLQGIGVAKATSAAPGSPQTGPWTKDVASPFISVGASGALDDAQIGFPLPLYDATESDANKRVKLFYHGKHTADGKWRTFLATSPDPATNGGAWNFTKQGVVIDVGAAGANDEKAARVGSLTFGDDNTWYAVYEGWDATGAGHMMYLSGASLTALTKQGTWFSPTPTATDQLLTAAMTTAPGRTVSVASTTGFQADAPVVLAQTTNIDTYVTSRIRKIVDAVTLELYHGVTGMTTAARVKQLDSGPNLSPRELVKVGTEWWFYGVRWEPFANTSEAASYAALLEENWLSKHANASPVGAVPVVDYFASPVISRGFNNDQRSLENMTLRAVPFATVAAPAAPPSGIHLIGRDRRAQAIRARRAKAQQLGARHVILIAAAVPTIPSASATGSLPLALGVSGTARARAAASGSIGLALGVTGTAAAPARATGSLPLALGVLGTSLGRGGPVALGTGSLGLALGVTGFGRTIARATGVLPITLGITGTATRPGSPRAVVDEPFQIQFTSRVRRILFLAHTQTGTTNPTGTAEAPMLVGRIRQGEVDDLPMQAVGLNNVPQDLTGTLSLTVTIWNPHVAPYAPIINAAPLSAVDLVTGKVSLREGFLVAGRLTAEIRAAWSDGTILKFPGPLVVDPSPTG